MFAKTFRNSLLASSLLIGASLLIAPVAMAAEDDLSVNDDGDVTGVVHLINEITFAPAEPTPIVADTGATGFVMGELSLRNNHANGWTLSVESANEGKLINGDHVIEYTNLIADSVEGETTNNFVNPATGGSLIVADYTAAVAAGVDEVQVKADIASGQHVPAGEYTDTLTFTLESEN